MSKRQKTACRTTLLVLGATIACTNALAHDLVICKASNPARPVTGTFNFTVTGVKSTVAISAGSCTSPMSLPADEVRVKEMPRAGTLLSAVTTCIPNRLSQREAIENCSRLIKSNFIDRTATVTVVEGDRFARIPYTTVTFTNEATPFVAPPGYTLTKVSIDEPRDINNQTQIVGVSTASNGQRHAFLWENGTARDLGTLGGATSVANGINRDGHVVGSSLTLTGQEHAFLWQDGVMHDLGTLGGATSAATAINDRGRVVGFAQTTNGQTHAFLWHEGEMRDLGTLVGPAGTSSASNINDRGQVVGQSTVSMGPMRAFLWKNGTMKDLGALSGSFDVGSSSARAINDLGVAVGVSSQGLNPLLSVFWDENGIHLINAGRSSAADINNLGQVIGNTDTGRPPFAQAYLFQNGVVARLFPQVDNPNASSIAKAINNRGQIVGNLSRFRDPIIEFQTSFLLSPD